MACFEDLLSKHAQAVFTVQLTVIAQNDLMCYSARLLCHLGFAGTISLLSDNNMHIGNDSSLEGLLLQQM